MLLCPPYRFPELSLATWRYTDPSPEKRSDADAEPVEEAADVEVDSPETAVPIQPYSVDDILADGCFLERSELETLLERLRTKKNLILQGPPGTGKTWLAKKLAFAMMGQRDESRLRALQFHPNMSYEDFVRGWRPTGEGKLALVDGPFMEMVAAASKSPSVRHVVVIEEIKRGIPAQIFGEMLTLMEADKHTPDEAIELCYRRSDGERVFIPDILIHGWYRDESIRSGYLYQIYAYLRSQEGNGDVLSEHASGMLLHPSVGQAVDETVVI